MSSTAALYPAFVTFTVISTLAPVTYDASAGTATVHAPELADVAVRVPEPMVTVTETPSTLPVSPVITNPAAFSEMFTTSSPAMTSRLSGSVGVVAGVDVAVAGAPSPTTLTALTSKVCSTPLSRHR